MCVKDGDLVRGEEEGEEVEVKFILIICYCYYYFVLFVNYYLCYYWDNFWFSVDKYSFFGKSANIIKSYRLSKLERMN